MRGQHEGGVFEFGVDPALCGPCLQHRCEHGGLEWERGVS